MSSLQKVLLLLVLLGVGTFAVVGCSSDGTTKPTPQIQSSADWKQGLGDDVVKALSQLSDADRTAALAQKVCPVTDKNLGSMGEPIKVTVKEQDVFLCCAACVDTIKNDPDKYLSKLNMK